eukprot:gene2583-18576_t
MRLAVLAALLPTPSASVAAGPTLLFVAEPGNDMLVAAAAHGNLRTRAFATVAAA